MMSPEVARIRALPRRTWSDADADILAAQMTSILRTPTGTMSLRPKQALALHDLGVHKGLVFIGRVGSGKTLVSLCAPLMVNASRPLLMLPAHLLDKTERERREVYAPHWKVATHLRLCSYQSLSRLEGARLLDAIDPDLIILDEAHFAKNLRAGVTRRLERYLKAHPNVMVVIMSGTLVKKGIRDCAHLIRWALKERAPVPDTKGETDVWADVLDEKGKSSDPGALLELGPREDAPDPVVQARRTFQRRLVETPGVVATEGDQVPNGLEIRALPFAPSAATDQNFDTLRSLWETPDGWPFTEAVQLWKCARELALGFHYVWDPRPPPEWLQTRREWAAFVRHTLQYSRHLDTELQVANACRDGALSRQELDAWAQVKPCFTPALKALWHDDSALLKCQAWMSDEPGIVWCEHTFFAHELARRTGRTYYGAQGLDSKGRPIESARPEDGSIIASVAANGTGRNLQAWSRNLVTSCLTDGGQWEQLLGRTHRDGQQADTVTCDVLYGCWEHHDAFAKARALAIATQDTEGSAQKLCMATIDWPEMITGRGPRWQKNIIVKLAA
jgi:hypothetical protein